MRARPRFLRTLRASPGLAFSVVLAWAAGFGPGSAVLARMGGPAGFSNPLLAGAGGVPEWRGGWSAALRTAGEQQAAALALLALIAGMLASLLAGIALVDLVTLLLTRAAARRPEMAMRAAVGASPRRLLGGLLGEGSALVLVAGAAGALVAAAAAAALETTWPAGAWPWAQAPGLPTAALCFAGFALVTTLCWLFPLTAAWRTDLRRHLESGTRATPGPGEGALRNGLVVLQIAASLVLLVAAGLLVRAFGGAESARATGFDPAGLLGMRVELPPGTGDAAARAGAYAAMIERVNRIPGVVDTSAASRGTWLGLGATEQVTAFCGACSVGIMFKPVSEGPALVHAVAPGFFRTIGATLVKGRELAPGDGAAGARSAVINDAFAARLFPNGEPIGKKVRVGTRPDEDFVVVGVVRQVGAAAIGSAAGSAAAVYLPLLAYPPRSVDLAVRAAGDPGALLSAVSTAVRAAAPGAGIAAAMTMEHQLEVLRAPLTWFGALFAALALSALLVAASSLYGVTTYGVRRRAREIGIRMAVGATERDVVRLIVGRSARLALVGTVVGLIGAMTLARVLQLLVRGIDPLDPLVYAPIALLLAGVAVVASYRPARRAVRLDPQLSLRDESA